MSGSQESSVQENPSSQRESDYPTVSALAAAVELVLVFWCNKYLLLLLPLLLYLPCCCPLSLFLFSIYSFPFLLLSIVPPFPPSPSFLSLIRSISIYAFLFYLPSLLFHLFSFFPFFTGGYQSSPPSRLIVEIVFIMIESR